MLHGIARSIIPPRHTRLITEFYSLGIPLFFPSMKYLQTVKSLGPDRSILSFCGKRNFPLNDSEMIPHPGSIHPYSPSAMDVESVLLATAVRFLSVAAYNLLR